MIILMKVISYLYIPFHWKKMAKMPEYAKLIPNPKTFAAGFYVKMFSYYIIIIKTW